MLYMGLVENILRGAQLGYVLDTLTSSIYASPDGLFGSMQNYLYLYIPLLTMGLMSKEFESGSIKLLYSSPITNKQIVLGKFFSMMFFGMILIFILFIVSIYGFYGIKDFDLPLVLTGLLGIYLLICTYASIGLFMSSLTSYQVVAAMGTFAVLFVLGLLGELWQDISFIRDITYWMSITGRSKTFIRGMICSQDVLYFILVSALFLLFTIFRLKSIREKSPAYISFSRYMVCFVAVAAIGYITTIPALMKYHDSTRTNVNTITQNSQKVISKLKGKIEVTTYVNIFDNVFSLGAPSNQKNDIARFEYYSRFYPDMTFDYKYYYALPVDKDALKSHKERFKGLTDQQAMEKICDIYDISPKLFKPGKDFSDEINLESELNRFVRKVKMEDGKVAYSRVFNDNIIFPGESQVGATFKSMVATLPLVGFVEGHRESNVNEVGDAGYFSLTKSKTFRYSLINNGFSFASCELSRPVDKKISILIIAGSKTAFSQQEIKNLNDYIDRGGNMLICGDTKRQDTMNPLLERLGVKFLPGQIAEHNPGYQMDLVTSELTTAGEKLSYEFQTISKEEGSVVMPGAVAISYTAGKEFHYTAVLTSDNIKNVKNTERQGSWNELNTTDFIDQSSKYNPQQGETPGILTTALALTRSVGGKNQKIMILGDSDCFSNGEFSRNRKNINAMNFNMATGVFSWLSDGEAPMDVRRQTPPDNELYTKKSDLPLLNTLYKIVIPGLFAAAFLLIWLRRRGR